ncbi:MAG: hypothetical protein ACKO1H_11020 [Tabrizicola sp.]
MAVTLGRRAFVRELALAFLFSLPLPMICLLGVYSSGLFPNVLVAALGTVLAALILAVPLLWYASFRLNAATLARERAVIGPDKQKIYLPMGGPLLSQSMVAGSLRSRILGGLPVTMGGILAFAIMGYVTRGSVFLPPLHIILDIALAIEAVVAVELLCLQELQPRSEVQ